MNQPQAPNSAETYQHYFVPAMFLPWAKVLLRCAAPKPGERVLDIACGTGIVAREAAPSVEAAGSVAALDINPAMLAVARAQPAPQGAAIEWREGSATALPFPDASFDLALCQHGLQFFPDRAAALREMRRVLAPGGRAVVMVLQALERHPMFAALGESVARHLGMRVEDVMVPFAMADADALRALFGGADFARVEVREESADMSFAEPERFPAMAIVSSAAAVPAFAKLVGPARAEMIAAIGREIAPTVQQFRQVDRIRFPMHALVAVATA